MATATLTSKGQLTLPAAIREELGLEAGDRIDFIRNESTGHYELLPASDTVRSLCGILPRPRNRVSIEDMNDAIARAAAMAGKIGR